MAAIRILNAQDVRRALPMAQAVAGMKVAYAALSSGRATLPLRSQIPIPDHNGTALFMPAYLAGQGDLAIKVVTVFPENMDRHEPTIYASVLVLDGKTGRPLALLEGSALTAIRTGAGSGAATDILARPESDTVAIIGSGIQARTQLEAVCIVRAMRQVRVYSPNRAHAEAFATEMAGQGAIPRSILVANSAAEAVRGADIVCAATTASKPVFDGRDLSPGCHVNAVGSFTAEMQEVDSTTVRQSLVVVDSRSAVLAEAGDLLVPLAAGEIEPGHIHAELGEIIGGSKPGRQSPEQITYFKSVGVAVQDVVASRIALENARALGLGTVIDF